MALARNHSFVNPQPDGADATIVRPSDWNANFAVSGATSGGIPYFSSATSEASSALLAANQIVLGGGAATAPATLGSLGTATTVLHGNASGAPSFAAVTPSDASGNTSGSGNFALVTSPTITTPIIASYTFATLPSAASNSGALARVTDIGPATAGSLWISNGTIWKPVNGRVTLLPNAARVSQAAGAGEVLSNVAFQIPTGFLHAGDKLRLWIAGSKAGTTTGFNLKIKMGTNHSTGDTQIGGSTANFLGNGSRSGGGVFEFTLVDNTHILAVGTGDSGNVPGNYGQSVSTAYPSTAGVAITDVSANSLWIEATITPGATDACAVEDGMIEYLSV